MVPYLKRPIRAAILTFVALAVFVGLSLPFQERPLRDSWPWAFVYCAFLSVAGVGLARLGRRAVLLIGVPFTVAVLPGVVGFALMLRSTSMQGGDGWLRLSLYLFYGLGFWGAYWIIRGWLLYFKDGGEKA
jgi:hypothetical protein